MVCDCIAVCMLILISMLSLIATFRPLFSLLFTDLSPWTLSARREHENSGYDLF